MQEYTSKQVAGWMRVLAGAFAIIGLGVLLFYARHRSAVALVGVAIMGGAWLLATFATLTARVTATEISWSFGIPLFSKSVRTADVKRVEVRRSPWYWGWGIRWTPKGWLWRSTGLHAAWIELDSGKQFGIGSNEPERLAEAIRARIDG